MKLEEFYNIPQSIKYETTEYVNGVEMGLTSSHVMVRAQSQVVYIDKLKNFQSEHWEYAHNYNYFMSRETLEMLFELKNTRMDEIIITLNDLYFEGFHIFIIDPYLKPGEILVVPQHDYETYEAAMDKYIIKEK